MLPAPYYIPQTHPTFTSQQMHKSKVTWHEENKALTMLRPGMYDWYTDLVLRDCVVQEVNVSGGENENLIIENCIIGTFKSFGTHYNGPVIIRNSIFIEQFMFSDGGYNKQEVVIENNIFHCHADFFDDVFDAPFVLRNNILLDGSNLFGFKGQSHQVTFRSGYTVEGNIGQLDFEG